MEVERTVFRKSEGSVSNPGRSIFEPAHDKSNKMACAPSEDSDQPGHSPRLIRVFGQAKTQISLGIPPADQSLCCPHKESLGP